MHLLKKKMLMEIRSQPGPALLSMQIICLLQTGLEELLLNKIMLKLKLS